MNDNINVTIVVVVKLPQAHNINAGARLAGLAEAALIDKCGTSVDRPLHCYWYLDFRAGITRGVPRC